MKNSKDVLFLAGLFSLVVGVVSCSSTPKEEPAAVAQAPVTDTTSTDYSSAETVDLGASSSGMGR